MPAALCSLIKYALPALIKSGSGAIINTSSGAALLGDNARTAYAASKAAVEHAVGLCRDPVWQAGGYLQRDLARHGADREFPREPAGHDRRRAAPPSDAGAGIPARTSPPWWRCSPPPMAVSSPARSSGSMAASARRFAHVADNRAQFEAHCETLKVAAE